MSSFLKYTQIGLPFARVICNQNLLWNGEDAFCLNGAPRPLDTVNSFINSRCEKLVWKYE